MRPCSRLLLALGNPFHYSELGKVLISQLLKKLADKKSSCFSVDKLGTMQEFNGHSKTKFDSST